MYHAAVHGAWFRINSVKLGHMSGSTYGGVLCNALFRTPFVPNLVPSATALERPSLSGSTCKLRRHPRQVAAGEGLANEGPVSESKPDSNMGEGEGEGEDAGRGSVCGGG